MERGAKIEAESLRVRQYWKPQVQIEAPRESASGAIPGDARVSIADGERRFWEDQTGERGQQCLETQEKQRHGNQGSSRWDHMHVAQESDKKEANTSVRPLAAPGKADLVTKWRQKLARRQLRNGGQ